MFMVLMNIYSVARFHTIVDCWVQNNHFSHARLSFLAKLLFFDVGESSPGNFHTTNCKRIDRWKQSQTTSTLREKSKKEKTTGGGENSL